MDNETRTVVFIGGIMAVAILAGYLAWRYQFKDQPGTTYTFNGTDQITAFSRDRGFPGRFGAANNPKGSCEDLSSKPLNGFFGGPGCHV